MEIEPSGIIRLVGWHRRLLETGELPAVYLDGTSIPFLQAYRCSRSDLTVDSGAVLRQAGLNFEYRVPSHVSAPGQLKICAFGEERVFASSEFHFLTPHYNAFFDSEQVLHRENVYGSGEPNEDVHPDIVSLAESLPSPILDYGCGRGVLVRRLRERNLEAFGLELDSPRIRPFIRAEEQEAITLYDGRYPSPIPAGKFCSVVCSEVLEHIPDYGAAVKDICRIASERVLFTVPDCSAIPLGFRHGAVPWHLMESSHFNFFSQSSLHNLLRPYFSRIEFGRIGLARFNDSPYYVSLACVCSK